jgi:DNA-binding NtrC family response regulator
LVADSDERRRARLASAVASIGCDVRDVPLPAGTVAAARPLQPDLVLIGLRPGDEKVAFAAVQEWRRANRRLPILLVVRDGSEELAVQAVRTGVKDYFPEPFDCAAVAASAKRCLRAAERRPDVDRDPVAAAPNPDPLVGESPCIRDLRAYLTKVARNDVTVLITGDTGTGKELAAAMIHDRSPRRHARFVSVNCAAIPEGLLESELFGHEGGAFTGAAGPRQGLLQLADHGTVFFDEIGDMGPLAQAKILRAIENREVYRLGGRRPIRLDIRVVAATNQDVERAVEEGRFRRDLYFRLNVARIRLPLLRERRSDIALLLDHHLRELNRRGPGRVEGFSDEALAALRDYDWPGNVRELRNLVEALFVCPPAGRVRIGDLPPEVRHRLRGACGADDAERRRLVEALFEANWNKSRAAQLLRWSRMTLYRKLAKHCVVRSEPAAGGSTETDSDSAVQRGGGEVGRAPRAETAPR